MYARLGAGLDSSLDAVLERVVRFERTVEPDAAAHDRYDELFGQLAARSTGVRSGLSEDGLLRPLWRAAGT